MQVEWFPNQEIDKLRWNLFVENSREGAIYAKTPFLDAVYPTWEAMICREGDDWMGVWPLFPNRKFGFRLQLQPPFCQHAGILFNQVEAKNVFKLYQFKNDVVNAFLAHLPHYHLFSLNFASDFDYPMPFYWHGFDLKTRYNYVIDLTEHPPEFENLRKQLQQKIGKAEKQGYTSQRNPSVKAFVNLARKDLVENKKVLSGSQLERLRCVANNLLEADLGELIGVYDQNGALSAAGLFGYTRGSCYYLMGVGSTEAKKQGAMPMLLWRAIQDAGKRFNAFDFEGSMISSIEHFFRGFGAKPVPYLRIYKNQLPLRPLWALFGY